ncbi:MAG TPA: folate-binding protein [Caulobacteraceae bacterium]|nr:folate-binding protein [Caulobacteraceae bacterium]
MAEGPYLAELHSRALISVSGPDWRPFLQGLLSQDVETLAPGELRFGALLTPQGRLLFDLFIEGAQDGCRLDVAAQSREALIERLGLYRLRAKVDIASVEDPVLALWPQEAPLAGWMRDPRLPALGLRGYGASPPAGAKKVPEASYEAMRIGLGVTGAADYPPESAYPIEANFDLLHGIDFQKGCFVGQETTSRMKRRGQVKSRMLALAVDGPPPPFGSEVLAGALRAGESRSAAPGRAMALVRLDRIESEDLTLSGRPARALRPAYFEEN